MDVDLPRGVWTRSGRPSRGTLIRWMFVASFLVSGLAAPSIVVKLVLIAGAAGVFFAVPVLADNRLFGVEREVLAATKRNATALLSGLEERRLVALFAPHGWVALQKARLHLVAGDGRAAAGALSECGRMCDDPKHVALLSGQARAFTLSGDRAKARELLSELGKQDAMSPRDHLDFGSLLLGDSGRLKQAQQEIERAVEVLGDHPQARAALAIVRVRDEQIDEATELLRGAEDAQDVQADLIAQELIKKARKALRPALKGATKKKSKAGARSSEAAPAPNKKGKKSDRRRHRRERRKAGRSSGRVQEAPVDVQPDTATSERLSTNEDETDTAVATGATASAITTAQGREIEEGSSEEGSSEEGSSEEGSPDENPVTLVPAAAEPAAPSKPGSLFNQIGSRVSLFKPPPLPDVPGPGTGRPSAPRVAVPKLSLQDKTPSKGSPPETSVPVAHSDAWDAMLDGDDPPAPLTKK